VLLRKVKNDKIIPLAICEHGLMFLSGKDDQVFSFFINPDGCEIPNDLNIYFSVKYVSAKNIVAVDNISDISYIISEDDRFFRKGSISGKLVGQGIVFQEQEEFYFKNPMPQWRLHGDAKLTTWYFAINYDAVDLLHIILKVMAEHGDPDAPEVINQTAGPVDLMTRGTDRKWRLMPLEKPGDPEASEDESTQMR
jgi:hypothetical protein